MESPVCTWMNDFWRIIILQYSTHRKFDLEKHGNTVHKGEKPFNCEFENCKSTFTEKSKMKIHIASAHEGKRPFTCTYESCEMSFGESKTLKNHMAVHQTEKSYKCEIENCKAAFTCKRYLTAHEKRVHNFRF